MTRVLVVGGGGREHALVRALLRSSEDPEVLCAPGNAGIAADGVRCLDIPATDVNALVAAAHAERVDLVVVGPEAPLVAGLVDLLGDAGLRTFGPSSAAARLEGSKAYAKDVMREAGVPTAPHVLLRTREEAEAQLACARYPAVLKADSLAAGKGVVMCADEREARASLDAFFTEQRFGVTTVVLEPRLEGEEISLLALCDGERAVPLAPARDFKRALDDDLGPNTGGMGSLSPVPGIGDAEVDQLSRLVHQPVLEELRRRGTPYHGILYAGVMLTPEGPRVLEYNCRFGDPEAQAVLPRLETDLLGLLVAASRPGGLAGLEGLAWSSSAAVTVVLASRGYPESSSSGDVIAGVDDAAALPGVEVLHAATAWEGGELVTAGGRVLNVTGLGADLSAARERAYLAADEISFPGRTLRGDIAAEAVAGVAR